MATEIGPKTPSNVSFWIGWVLTGLPALMFVMGGVMAIMQPPFVIKEMEKYGYAPEVAPWLGVVELICAVLYLVPRTAVLGAILLTGYLGGATSTHVRFGDPWLAPVIFGVVLWLGLYLRDARLRALVPLRQSVR